MGSKVSRRYAKALLSLGEEDGKYEDYGKDLQDFTRFCTDQQDFFRAVANQIFPVEDRKNLFEAVVAKSPYSDVIKNFLRLLLEKNRLDLVEEITEYYTRLTDELSNITRAEVITARPLKDEALGDLGEALKGLTSKEVKMDVQEDESLIGGLVVRIGDLVLDGSVKAQLVGLKESLKRGE